MPCLTVHREPALTHSHCSPTCGCHRSSGSHSSQSPTSQLRRPPPSLVLCARRFVGSDFIVLCYLLLKELCNYAKFSLSLSPHRMFLLSMHRISNS
ncbi:uncharacterized protein DS421_18g611370 [Arachis hypogaea]|nr:uncharacterized protein DS421_18g611370 [Arachis hypogaea]